MQLIGRFEIIRRLGGGGFGEVFLARDPAIGREVAIKIFRPRDENVLAFVTSTDEEALQVLRDRFLSEARILASLEDEPHVVNVHEYGLAEDGAPFYVMPYLPHSLAEELGQDLLDFSALENRPVSARPRALPMGRALTVIEQLLTGLAAAHARGLIHRDIKPSNLMLSQAGELRIVDFGIAKVPDSHHSTVSHLGIGSRNYIAPEQRESAKHVDTRADIYAVGVVAYRSLTGRLPVGRFPDPIELVPALGRPMNDLILAMMAISREQRPTDASEALMRFRQALAHVGEGAEATTRVWQPAAATEVHQARSTWPRVRPLWWAAAVLGAMVIAAMSFIWLGQDPEDRPVASLEAASMSEPQDDQPSLSDETGDLEAPLSDQATQAALPTSGVEVAAIGTEADSAEAWADESSQTDSTGPAAARSASEPVPEAPAPSRIDPERRLVQETQAELRRLGRDIEVDGLFGPGTAAHVRAFELASGQPEQGEVTPALLASLRQAERWPSIAEQEEIDSEAVEQPPEWQAGQRIQDCDGCPELVVIPAGRFTMGSPPAERQRRAHEGPQREVDIAVFALGVQHVTFAQYDACVEAGGCSHRPHDRGWGRGARPVIDVNWHQAMEYVEWLSDRSGVEYRLPSEAEWEYAARAGTTTRFNAGDCINRDQANYNGLRQPRGCVRGPLSNRPSLAGAYPANSWGLFDMHGNLADWVADCWNDSYAGAPSDGRAWLAGHCNQGIQRGGSWYQSGDILRSASRVVTSRDYSNFYLGFRVARSLHD